MKRIVGFITERSKRKFRKKLVLGLLSNPNYAPDDHWDLEKIPRALESYVYGGED